MDILIYLMVFGPMAAAILSYLLGRKSKSGRDRLPGRSPPGSSRRGRGLEALYEDCVSWQKH